MLVQMLRVPMFAAAVLGAWAAIFLTLILSLRISEWSERSLGVALPLLTIVVIAAECVAFTYLLRRARKWLDHRAKRPDWQCAVCGYDLRGLFRRTGLKCPECGARAN